MAIGEDILKAAPGQALAVGLAILAIPVLFPMLRPRWAAAVKAGAKLFLEAEVGAEDEIIGGLAESAIVELADAVASLPKEGDRSTGAIVRAYTSKARERARRLGWSERDREARYRRHIDRLRRAAAHHSDASSGAARQAWDEVGALLGSADATPQLTAIGGSSDPSHDLPTAKEDNDGGL
jgi:hypothetical protein